MGNQCSSSSRKPPLPIKWASKNSLQESKNNFEPIPLSDLTFAAFGITGHGKSSILNSLAQRQNLFKEGSSLDSTTTKIEANLIQYKGKQVLLIDTPGLLDSKSQDRVNLKSLMGFLRTVKNGFTLIIYVYSLLQEKFDASMQISFKLLGTLFGQEVYERVRIVLTHIDELNSDAQKARLLKFEEELPSRLDLVNILPINSKFYHFFPKKAFGNLKKLYEEAWNMEKLIPHVLDSLDDKDFSCMNEVELILKLGENSRQMQKFQEQIKNIAEEKNQMMKMNEKLDLTLKNLQKDKGMLKGELEQIKKEYANKFEAQKVELVQVNERNILKIKELEKNLEEKIRNWQPAKETKSTVTRRIWKKKR